MRASSPTPRRRRARTAAALAMSLLTAAAPAATAGTPRTAGTTAVCKLRPGQSHRDSLGNVFQQDLYCDNLPSDVLGRSAYDAPVTGRLKLSPSWFTCWTEGEAPEGQTRVWYYTQGDEVVKMPRIKGWGVVPARVVQAPQHPFPGLPRCPWV
ncbi:hypothetical protein [Streptomyces griseocarneus]|uniref:hypothetical protein n=1 Tax=Streptomyces griseocarneus TaxID=51201 RepID=UPI00167DA190|nr:hypothetical protein [Streptomyces griseocarneus]MBZ6477978.1 hypothetical protein [Streptomyces griseocarneus]GHG54611.1 hypothetical protein GCM10018779_17710 [Streptomyces griseocarneus]